MQLVSSKIWTRVAVFIFYDDNHYTTGTSIIMLMGCIYFGIDLNDIVSKSLVT